MTLLAGTLATSTATADDYVASDKKGTFDDARTELGFGMLVGGYGVGPVGGAGVGLHLDVGRQMGDLKLYGEYNFLSIGEAYTEEDPVRGVLHRGGLAARYNFATLGGGRYKPIQGAFWLEAGLGRQYIRWNEGGVLERDDVSFGFGAQFNFMIGKNSPNPKVLGFYYAFKAMVARAPDADEMAPATCGGPCDRPTGPSPYDVGAFFNMGLQFGR
jgi:hypothetical protein